MIDGSRVCRGFYFRDGEAIDPWIGNFCRVDAKNQMKISFSQSRRELEVVEVSRSSRFRSTGSSRAPRRSPWVDAAVLFLWAFASRRRTTWRSSSSRVRLNCPRTQGRQEKGRTIMFVQEINLDPRVSTGPLWRNHTMFSDITLKVRYCRYLTERLT